MLRDLVADIPPMVFLILPGMASFGLLLCGIAWWSRALLAWDRKRQVADSLNRIRTEARADAHELSESQRHLREATIRREARERQPQPRSPNGRFISRGEQRRLNQAQLRNSNQQPDNTEAMNDSAKVAAKFEAQDDHEALSSAMIMTTGVTGSTPDILEAQDEVEK